MLFINTKTKEYNIDEYQIKSMYPNVSFPTNFTGDDVYRPVKPKEFPSYDVLREYVVEDVPVLINGEYEQNWKIVKLDDAQIETNIKFKKEQVISELTITIQYKLDNFAREKGYDNILSASTYVNSTNERFKEEAKRAIEIRDSTWEKFYSILDEAEREDTILTLSIASVESKLPELSW